MSGLPVEVLRVFEATAVKQVAVACAATQGLVDYEKDGNPDHLVAAIKRVQAMLTGANA